MSEVDRKRNLIVIRHSPYGSSLARASVDIALAMGAFDQDFELLFMGAGVLQLLKNQHSEDLGCKNVGKTLSSLPMFDKEFAYVDAAALAQFGLKESDLVLPVRLLEQQELAGFLNDCDHVISC